jgi:hypothetical protein
MEELQLEHPSGQWRLFIASTKINLKAVLLHSGNKSPSILLDNAFHVKEMYEERQVCCKKICYEEHRWNICADLKVIGMLTGLQGRYAKLCCL